MGRVYKRKTDRQFNEGDSKKAVADVLFDNWSIRSAAKEHGLSKSKLAYLVKKAKENGLESINFKSNFKNRQIFSDDMEVELADYLLISSKMFYGLTPKQTKLLAYQYAKKNGIKIPSSWDREKCAGDDWFTAFMARKSSLSLRTPEATSLARMTAFNRHTVNIFFDKLKIVMERHNFRPHEIFNLDETGVTTVQKVEKVVSEKGQKQVGQVTSRERGELITQVSIVCANGNALPPVWVFPRIRFDETKMMAGAPAGALGLVHKSGWMTCENFRKVVEFFIKNVRCSKEKPVLLIFDNHESHLDIPALDLCKDNGIVVLTLPPHTSNKLQPLDTSVFSPFKKYIASAINGWMTSNPNRTLNIYELPKLCSSSWDKAATPENVKSGFRVTGICPYNRDIFRDDDFLPSSVSDRPNPTDEPLPGPSSFQHSSTTPEPKSLQTPSITTEINSGHPSSSRVSPAEIRPFPKAPPRLATRGGRKQRKCIIATDTPEKKELENRKKPVSTTVKRSIFHSTPTISSSEEEEYEEEALCDEPGDSPLSSEEESETSSDDDNIENVTEGNFVLVKFPNKKDVIYFIGKITKTYNTFYDVTFLRKRGIAFVFPDVEDESVINKEDIAKILQLQSSRRGKFYFKKNIINKYNLR